MPIQTPRNLLSKDEQVQIYRELPENVKERIQIYIQDKIDHMMRNDEKSTSIFRMRFLDQISSQFSCEGRYLASYSNSNAYDYALQIVKDKNYKIIIYPTKLLFFLPRGFQIFNPTLEKKA